MAEESFKRKLTAILSADVKGYSRLMREDEEGTIRTLTAYREVTASHIQQHHGRVVDSPGDNVLAEFTSVVDAVRCAVEIQKDLQGKNADLPKNRRMEFRIGVNLGDVVEEGERIYGDGVNIAARVEGLAEGGGICISGTVYEHVKDKLTFGYESLGEHRVKNISEPVRVYRVLMEPEAAGKVIGEKRLKLRGWQWAALTIVAVLTAGATVVVWQYYLSPSPPSVEPASVERMAFPLPDKPSIAVLPLDNLSGDPEQEYFSDGITESIITTLSKSPRLFVVARNSTFTYKGKPVKVQQVSEELGVRYVLEGGVQKAGDRVRVTIQLVDATTGHHLWAERYDRDLKDIFALQDEITMNILEAIQVKLTAGELARLAVKGTDNIEALMKVSQGGRHFLRMNKEDNILARRMYEEAIALDPEYAVAYSFLGWTHSMDVAYGSSKSPMESLGRAAKLAQKALALDDSEPVAHNLLGFLYLLKGDHEKAIAEHEQAIALNPNFADSYVGLARILDAVGRSDEAIALCNRAIRFNPFPPSWYYYQLCSAYASAGMYEAAITAGEKAVSGGPDSLWAHLGLAIAYSLAGFEEEARAEAEEVLRIDPNYSVAHVEKGSLQRDPAIKKRYLDALRKAGLPNKPPLPLSDKPSIAVLPFTNMSEEPEQEYFADGMTDDLITDLSKISGLFVIARNSAFSYKGKAVKVDQISRELGVRYVLEGSVRKAGDRLRINAQLIDATTGGHLWAERYDGELGDVFDLQDRITRKIVTALAVKLTADEQEQVARKDTDSLEAYDAFLKGRAFFFQWTPEDLAKAFPHFEKAVELDPNYGRALASLAHLYYEASAFNWQESLGVSWPEARLLAHQYLQMAMKSPTAIAHQVAGEITLHRRQYAKALAEIERAMALDPNDPVCHTLMALMLICNGRPQEAFGFIKRAERLDPNLRALCIWLLGFTHFTLRQLEEAVPLFERADTLSPKNLGVLICLASAYGHLGRDEEAWAAVQKVAKLFPIVPTVGRIMYHYPFKDPEDADYFAQGLIKAGFPATEYYTVSEEDELTGEEIRDVVFGRTVTGLDPHTGKQWWKDHTKEGKVTYPGGIWGFASGTFRIDADMLWYRWEKQLQGREYSECVFRNPKGTPEMKNEYLSINDFGIYPWSPVE